GFIAYTAGAVFVDFPGGNGSELQVLTRVPHLSCQRDRLADRHAIEIDGHQPGCDLIIRNFRRHITADECSDFFRTEYPSIPLLLDDFAGGHLGGCGKIVVGCGKINDSEGGLAGAVVGAVKKWRNWQGRQNPLLVRRGGCATKENVAKSP